MIEYSVCSCFISKETLYILVIILNSKRTQMFSGFIECSNEKSKLVENCMNC